MMQFFKRKKPITAGELLGKDSTAFQIARAILDSDGLGIWEIEKSLGILANTIEHHVLYKTDSFLNEGLVYENDGRYYATPKLEKLFYELDLTILLTLNLILFIIGYMIVFSWEIKFIIMGVVAFLLVVFSRAR